MPYSTSQDLGPPDSFAFWLSSAFCLPTPPREGDVHGDGDDGFGTEALHVVDTGQLSLGAHNRSTLSVLTWNMWTAVAHRIHKNIARV